MKSAAMAALVIALISLVVGMVLRIFSTSTVMGLMPLGFLRFANTCLLFTIAFGVIALVNRK
ncbi:MAG: hypothetical protein P9M13_08055 [Candidatus Ancaeobacter aquaticus]|nr:hypothetical protein [Candidatus Ancaeobacter aquaticus]